MVNLYAEGFTEAALKVRPFPNSQLD
jgi:hypothetical protein